MTKHKIVIKEMYFMKFNAVKSNARRTTKSHAMSGKQAVAFTAEAQNTLMIIGKETKQNRS